MIFGLLARAMLSNAHPWGYGTSWPVRGKHSIRVSRLWAIGKGYAFEGYAGCLRYLLACKREALRAATISGLLGRAMLLRVIPDVFGIP